MWNFPHFFIFFLTGSLIDMTKLTMNDAIDVLWYYGINTALDLEEVRIQYQAATYKTAHGVRESHLDPLEGEHHGIMGSPEPN